MSRPSEDWKTIYLLLPRWTDPRRRERPFQRLPIPKKGEVIERRGKKYSVRGRKGDSDLHRATDEHDMSSECVPAGASTGFTNQPLGLVQYPQHVRHR